MRYLLTGLLFPSAFLLVAGCSEEHRPEQLLSGVAWSFRETAANDLQSFVEDVYRYNDEIGYPIPLSSLESPIGISAIAVRYEYHAEHPAVGSNEVEWVTEWKEVEIRSDGASLSAGEILFKIHQAAHPYLKAQDHSYFEGLSIVNGATYMGLPVYEVFLGS